jgi:hypothetical protein
MRGRIGASGETGRGRGIEGNTVRMSDMLLSEEKVKK